jgi:hypothetical protein
MSLQAFALILLAGLIHAGWNIAAKKAGGDARFAFFSSLLLVLVWAPLAWWVGHDVVPHWGWQAWALVAEMPTRGSPLTITPTANFALGDLVMVADCAGASMLQVTNAGAGAAGSAARPTPTVASAGTATSEISTGCHRVTR